MAFRIGVVFCLIGGALLIAGASEHAPIAVFLGLATTLWPLERARRAARGTALGAAVIWAGLAVGLGLVSQAVAWSESPASGRPLAGHGTYLATLATLAALISVLNARTPGGGAWAILMGLLVLVFLIPWLEGPGLARNARGLGRLRLDTPWTIFYVLLVVAGVTNYLPTRYGLAAAWLAVRFAMEYVGLTRNKIAVLAGGPSLVRLPLDPWRRRSGRPTGGRGVGPGPREAGWSGPGSGSATTGGWSGPCGSRSGSTARPRRWAGRSGSAGSGSFRARHAARDEARHPGGRPSQPSRDSCAGSPTPNGSVRRWPSSKVTTGVSPGDTGRRIEEAGRITLQVSLADDKIGAARDHDARSGEENGVDRGCEVTPAPP